ncbi:MAG: hypothetical protein AAGF55_13825 [Pseudomonadota bacterium]
MRTAAILLLISAALHVVGFVLGGFEPIFLLFPPVLYVVLAAGLSRGKIWVAWIALICMLGGSAGAIVELFNPSSVPTWVFQAILTADLAAALTLFGAIWTGRRTEETT